MVDWLKAHPPHLGGCDSPDESSIESDESDEESYEEEAPSRAMLPAEQQKARLNKKRRRIVHAFNGPTTAP